MIFNMYSDSGIGVEVVNGMSAPTNPDENTVWIKTTLTIQDVYIAASAPTTSTEGDVWINTSGTAACTITLSNDPSTTVNICSLNVYTSGAWTDVGGGVQTSSGWVDMTYKVYGISRSIDTDSYNWTRTDNAVGMTATASVGTVAGSSDFDSCYPWSGIVRETLSTGDVMVKIPKFWYKRYRENNIEYIKIADADADGFTLHPAFNHAGTAEDYVYVGAYMTSNKNKSVSGGTPATGTRATMRTNAKAKGTGWGLMDIAAMSAVQMLILVEFASNEVQSNIGYGNCKPTVGISGGALLNTGTCDSVPNLTGQVSSDMASDVIWRGVEGFWGNQGESVDGINWYNGTYYVCNNPAHYADDTSTNYTALSYTGSTSWDFSYITKIGLDTGNNTHVMAPEEAGSGSSISYFSDDVCSGTGWKTVWRRGLCSDYYAIGLFNLMMSTDSSYKSLGSRLMYIP